MKLKLKGFVNYVFERVSILNDLTSRIQALRVLRLKEVQTRALHTHLSMAQRVLIDSMPGYSADDLVVVTRNFAMEVWTLRDFAPCTLMFAPETHDIKDIVIFRLFKFMSKVVYKS